MKALFKLLTCLHLAAIHAHALTAEEIREIAKKPHNRENLVEALKMFPEARKYKVTQTSGPNMDALQKTPEVVVMEKTVEGTYIVSQTAPDNPVRVIMVVHHDPKTNVFRKWIMGPDGSVGSSTGVADTHTRTIAWVSDSQLGMNVLVHETHGDKLVTWREVIMMDGKIEAIAFGKAIKVE